MPKTIKVSYANDSARVKVNFRQSKPKLANFKRQKNAGALNLPENIKSKNIKTEI